MMNHFIFHKPRTPKMQWFLDILQWDPLFNTEYLYHGKPDRSESRDDLVSIHWQDISPRNYKVPLLLEVQIH